MPHIITDPEYRELTAYRRLGLSPDEIAAKLDYLTEPAPLPLEADECPIIINDWEDK